VKAVGGGGGKGLLSSAEERMGVKVVSGKKKKRGFQLKGEKRQRSSTAQRQERTGAFSRGGGTPGDGFRKGRPGSTIKPGGRLGTSLAKRHSFGEPFCLKSTSEKGARTRVRSLDAHPRKGRREMKALPFRRKSFTDAGLPEGKQELETMGRSTDPKQGGDSRPRRSA